MGSLAKGSERSLPKSDPPRDLLRSNGLVSVRKRGNATKIATGDIRKVPKSGNGSVQSYSDRSTRGRDLYGTPRPLFREGSSDRSCETNI